MATKMYNTSTWRNIRKAYLMENPECELCSARGKVTLAEEVHHIDHIADANNELDAMDRAFDSGNLMSLCKACHSRIHAIERHGALIAEDKEIIEKYNALIRAKNKHE